MDAVQCGILMWNTARDWYGNSTGAFFKLDQGELIGDSDVTAVYFSFDDPPGTQTWGEMVQAGYYQLPSVMRLAPQLVLSDLGPDDRCRVVAHELAHKLGGANSGNCQSPWSILIRKLYGAQSPGTNQVKPQDVALINRAWKHPELCTVSASAGPFSAAAVPVLRFEPMLIDGRLLLPYELPW
jgi:hypothetical protein